MMKTRCVLMMSVIATGLAVGPAANADETSDTLKELRRQIDLLEQKVRILEEKQSTNGAAAFVPAPATPLVSLGSAGVKFSSADTNFSFSLHGLLQVDNRSFFKDGGITGNDGFLLRRARPIFQGTVFRDFDYRFEPDFAGASPQIFDAYANYRCRPWLQFRAGKFKTPFGLEQLQSDTVLSFNERSLATDLVPNRDIGFQLWGEVANGRFNYALAVLNGVADGRNSSNADFENHREFAGRVYFQPFKSTPVTFLEGLGFGLAGTWGNVSSNSAGLANGFLSDGQQTWFAYTNGVVANGVHWRLSPQAYYVCGPLNLLGEYILSDQGVQRTAGAKVSAADLQNAGWDISAGWVLTGERPSFTGLTPNHPFDLGSGHWGAFQVVARFAELDLDPATFPVFANPGVSASTARSWAVGVNWYLNKNVRVDASYSHTDFGGGGGIRSTTAPGIVTRQPEQVFFSRLQLAF